MKEIFPGPEMANRAISIVPPGGRQEFSALMVDMLPDLHLSPDGAQCFPLKLYHPIELKEPEAKGTPHSDLFEETSGHHPVDKASVHYKVSEAVTDVALQRFRLAYASEVITKDDLFYYVYGILHSQDYKRQFADNLRRELPRIPVVQLARDFWTFSSEGRNLATLHVDYETVEQHPATLDFLRPRENLNLTQQTGRWIK